MHGTHVVGTPRCVCLDTCVQVCRTAFGFPEPAQRCANSGPRLAATAPSHLPHLSCRARRTCAGAGGSWVRPCWAGMSSSVRPGASSLSRGGGDHQAPCDMRRYRPPSLCETVPWCLDEDAARPEAPPPRPVSPLGSELGSPAGPVLFPGAGKGTDRGCRQGLMRGSNSPQGGRGGVPTDVGARGPPHSLGQGREVASWPSLDSPTDVGCAARGPLAQRGQDAWKLPEHGPPHVPQMSTDVQGPWKVGRQPGVAPTPGPSSERRHSSPARAPHSSVPFPSLPGGKRTPRGSSKEGQSAAGPWGGPGVPTTCAEGSARLVRAELRVPVYGLQVKAPAAL
ncbi:collagen alpha-1(I) chain-like [Mustela putorius furo]|uniref:Collagen alpha-1(I) chain-like n=1 Tax=Mustela putorius furo TaxID=9669 RepID=A0A8U0SCX3_MUSPF|nr:collagen alpha-1(I) chain-like [Mustela putorius furo]XP_012916817.1 collagen alpha-1(I) chain-like [Mustela putorius furo]XP_012916822.1 collagen alpha-1(I) chain-like [Mustela putorius furo]XP_044940332.1 collagen alpha-1(I) chain-like [Mustela putorius furo]XP_044940333.1 collagen alpha-1(I) chain-like [Mustela putorius furo]XP_044940334.1 collagen alpha-1(I) chain-like [Mustela putorius furo]XP_044940335.1 collagen alpha-1(I) chain-like [Mustela putorius furo]XP_044940336.1 collagen a